MTHAITVVKLVTGTALQPQPENPNALHTGKYVEHVAAPTISKSCANRKGNQSVSENHQTSKLVEEKMLYLISYATQQTMPRKERPSLHWTTTCMTTSTNVGCANNPKHNHSLPSKSQHALKTTKPLDSQSPLLPTSQFRYQLWPTPGVRVA